MNIEKLVLLQQLKLDALTEKARIQNNGRALEMPQIEPEPQEADYDDINSITPSLDEVLPLNIATSARISEATVSATIAPPSTEKPKTLAERVKSMAADKNQIGMDEAIATASSETAQDTATASCTLQMTATPPTLQQAIPTAPEASTVATAPQSPRAQKQSRLAAYLQARSAWYVERMQKNYQYACTCKQVKDMCYGIDFMIAVLDSEIKRVYAEKVVEEIRDGRLHQ